MTADEQVEQLRQETRQLRQDLVNQRQMWKMAIAMVLDTPDTLHLIGSPDQNNEVREALRPVAELARRPQQPQPQPPDVHPNPAEYSVN